MQLLEAFVGLSGIVVELDESLCRESLVVVIVFPALWIMEAVLTFPIFKEDRERFREPGERIDEAECGRPGDACGDFVRIVVCVDAEIERDEAPHGESDDEDVIDFFAKLSKGFVGVVVPVFCLDTDQCVRCGVVSP